MWYTLLPKVLNMSLTAGIVILCVLPVRLILKRAPKVFSYALWAVVLFRLLCPVSLTSSISLLGIVDVPVTKTSAIEYIPPNVVHAEFPHVDTPAQGVGEAVNETLPQGEEQLAADPLEFPATIAAYIWILGIGALLVYSAVSLMKLRRKLVGAMPLRDNIFLADHIASPFVIGLLRPKIYLPSSLSGGEQEYIIAHEQHHIRRLDHALKILAFAALCIHWFNPLVWLAFVLSGKDMEMSCDEAVLKKLGGGIREDYSASLLSLATGRRIIAGTPLAFGEGNTKGRIRNALSWKKPTAWILIAAAALCVAVVIPCAVNPKEEELNASMPFGHSYQVQNIVYDAPQYSFAYTTQTAPEYTLTADYQLMVLEDKASDNWLQAGGFSEVTLAKENFDEYFARNGDDPGWQGDSTAAQIRRENQKSWRLIVSDNPNGVFYYLLQQKNGDVYLAYGYNNPDSESDDSSIRWLFKLAAYVSLDAGSHDIVKGETYVSYSSIFMNPLSSYYPFGGDSGCRYIIGEDSFTIENRSGEDIQNIAPVEWGWQEFPWTNEQWLALYPEGFGISDISERYTEMLYQPLSGGLCLLRMDGRLWLADVHDIYKIGKQLWSIYTLVPESAMGSAQWEYKVTDSQYPPFRFKFDMPYTEISAACVDGELIGLDDRDADEYSRGPSLTVPSGSSLYWSPMNEKGESALSAQIRFTVHDGDTMLYAGRIYITGEKVEDSLDTIYTATLAGGGLFISQATEYSGAVVATAEHSVGNLVYDLSPEGELSVPAS